MPSIADIYADVAPTLSPDGKRRFERSLTRIDGSRAGVSIGQSLGKGMRVSMFSSVRGMVGPLAAAFGAIKVGQLFSGFITEARESERVSNLTAQAIKTTGGAAKISASQVGALATAISNKTGVDDEAIQSGANLLLCLEESAQALTRDRGWVTHEDLRVGDQILAYDPTDDTSRWEPILDFYRYQVDTELIHWKSKQIDVKTTPHHRWWTVGQNDKARYTPQFSTTEEISGKQIRVKIGGGLGEGFASEPVWSDELVELAGWVITEGTAGWIRPSTPLSNQVSLTQSETANPEKVKQIRGLMDRLRSQGHRIGEGSAIMPYNGSTMLTWWFARDLGATLRAMLPEKKLSMRLVTGLTREQAEMLLAVLIDGDGHIDKYGHRQYIQKDRGQLDLLAAMCAMLGIRTTDVPSRSTAGSLYLNTTNHAYGNRLNAERVRYSGVVWCPQIRTGVFMARSRGRTFWTGNTFKNVRNEVGRGNDIFNRATAAALDLSKAGFGDLSGTSKQLGKALNDPIKGIAALSRAGVTFTAQQKEQIKTLVESGHVLDAQRIILKEVESQVGGAAAATTTPMQKLAVTIGNLKETIGAALLPIIDRAATWLGQRLPAALALGSQALHLIRMGFTDGETDAAGFAGVLQRIGDTAFRAFDSFKTEILPRLREFGGFLVGTVIPALADFGGWLVKNRSWLIPIAAGIGAVIAAVKVWTAVSRAFAVVQGIVNAVLAANPIGIVVLALVGLVAALVVAYKTSDTFRNIVQKAWQGIQVAVAVAWNNVIKPVFAALSAFVTNVVGPAVSWLWRSVVVPAFNGIRAVIQVVWPIIRGIFQTWVAFMRNVVGPAVSWLWRNVVAPVFTGIKNTISAVWTNGIRPILAALGSFIRDKVAPAFSAGVAAIGRAWDRLKALATAPVNFVIGTVLNRGIFAAYNWVVSKFGGTKIPNLPLIGGGPGRAQGRTTAGLASGGVMPFITDGPRAIVGEGNPRYPEYVIPTDPHHRTRALSLYQDLGTRMYADGGIVGAGVKEGIKRAAGIVTGNLTDPARYLREKIAAALRGIGGSGFAQTIAGVPRAIGSILIEKVKGLFSGLLRGGGFASSSGGWPARVLGQLSPNTAAAVNFIRQTFGISNIGTLGNRPNASDHPFGKALDAMIPNWQSSAGIALGNRIASWFVANPGRFGTKYVIWRDQINSGRGWMPYTHPLGPTSNPTLRHMDHVHVSLFGRGGKLPHVGLAGGGTINEPVFGVGRSGRTYSLGERGPERVTPVGRPTIEHHWHVQGIAPFTARDSVEVWERYAIMHGL